MQLAAFLRLSGGAGDKKRKEKKGKKNESDFDRHHGSHRRGAQWPAPGLAGTDLRLCLHPHRPGLLRWRRRQHRHPERGTHLLPGRDHHLRRHCGQEPLRMLHHGVLWRCHHDHHRLLRYAHQDRGLHRRRHRQRHDGRRGHHAGRHRHRHGQEGKGRRRRLPGCGTGHLRPHQPEQQHLGLHHPGLCCGLLCGHHDLWQGLQEGAGSHRGGGRQVQASEIHHQQPGHHGRPGHGLPEHWLQHFLRRHHRLHGSQRQLQRG